MTKNKNSCSAHSTSKDNKDLYGTSAFLHSTSEQGGIDEFEKKVFGAGTSMAYKSARSTDDDIPSYTFLDGHTVTPAVRFTHNPPL